MGCPVSDRSAADSSKSAVRSGQAAGVAGLIFAGLLATSLLMILGIESPAAGQDLTQWFEEEASRTISIVGLYLVPFAGIAFLWFMAVLRDRAGSREDRFFDTVLLGSGLIFVAMLYAGAAARTGLVADTGVAQVLDVSTVHASQLLSSALFNVYGARAAGVFMMVSSSIILRTGSLPRWLGLLGVPLALVLLLGTSAFHLLIFVFPVWVALVSITLLVQLAQAGRTTESPK